MIEYIKKVEKKKLIKRKDDKIILAKSLNIGYYLIIPLLLGIFLGIWLDKIFQTKPVFIFLFFLLGVMSFFYNLWKITKEFKS